MKTKLGNSRGKLAGFLLFAYFAVFSFGQLARVDVSLLGVNFPIVFIDAIGLLLFVLCIFEKNKPYVWKYFKWLFLIYVLSFLFSVFSLQYSVFGIQFSVLSIKSYVPGFLYLLRLLGILGVFLAVYSLIRVRGAKSRLVTMSLVSCALFTAIFGWVQYFLYSNFRPFTVWGWDDHLYRLIGTFLDPGFTAIILVFGFLASLAYYLKPASPVDGRKTKHFLLISIFLFASILFTYSRAGYLGLGVGVAYLLRNNLRLLAFSLLLFALSLMLLPRPGGEGVNLARTASIGYRFENYQETFEIFKTSPVFGIGYNNLCLYKQKVFNADPSSHSCGGADASLLLILSTTGVLGLISFVFIAFKMVKSAPDGFYKEVFIASSLALLLHSQFGGSLFYPWALGWLLIIYALSI